MKRKRLISVIFIILVLGISNAFAGQMKVVASISPVGDMVKAVGGERVQVSVLLPPGASPHTFEPTFGMAKAISQARLFFEIGAGLDFWGEKLVKASKENIRITALSDGINLLEEEGEHGLEHKTGNPHIWLDPVLAMEMVKKIEKVLEEADPVGAEEYRKRSAAYLNRLRALDEEIRKTVSTFTIKSFVSFHPAWDYFAHRYGLRSVGVIEESPGKDPSPRKLEAIVKAIKDYRIRAVFAETQFNPKAAEVISREAGVKVIMLDPEGGLKGRDTYIGLMKFNLEQMKKAMQ